VRIRKGTRGSASFLDVLIQNKLNPEFTKLSILDSLRIPIGYRVRDKGLYSLNFEFAEDFIFSHNLYLIDNYTGHSVLIENRKYDFVVHEPGNDVRDRFYLSLKPKTKKDFLAFEIYPNPSLSNFVFINSNQRISDCVLQIFNSSGLKISHFSGLTDNRIDLTEFKPGVYFLKLTHSSGQQMKKLIIPKH